jgi:2-oxoglutarate ferredoxin oxidoreductase subunit gamma
MTDRIIMAGWGGQGLMTLGKFLVNVAMREGMQVTWFPSYGAEVRGGTAHCEVVLSSEPIYLAIVEHADTLIMMNQPSYDKFHMRIKPDGLILLNSTMVTDEQPHPGAQIIRIPATDIANDIGDVRVSNMVMLGAYHSLKSFFPVDAIHRLLREMLTGRKAALVDLNIRALERGAAAVKEAL